MTANYSRVIVTYIYSYSRVIVTFCHQYSPWPGYYYMPWALFGVMAKEGISMETPTIVVSIEIL